jgi:hypothetical protein
MESSAGGGGRLASGVPESGLIAGGSTFTSEGAGVGGACVTGREGGALMFSIGGGGGSGAEELAGSWGTDISSTLTSSSGVVGAASSTEGRAGSSGRGGCWVEELGWLTGIAVGGVDVDVDVDGGGGGSAGL